MIEELNFDYHIALYMSYLRVLFNYLCADFEGNEKPKGGPLEIEIFLSGWRRGLEGGSVAL